MKITKILSLNDTGETDSHQAGFHIPRTIVDFFPKLNISEKNPRTIIRFKDHKNNFWSFNFIYYNNKYFGGTRNEFRLTGTNKYFKQNKIVAGDRIYLESKKDYYFIFYKKSKKQKPKILNKKPKKNIITLTNKWKVISL